MAMPAFLPAFAKQHAASQAYKTHLAEFHKGAGTPYRGPRRERGRAGFHFARARSGSIMASAHGPHSRPRHPSDHRKPAMDQRYVDTVRACKVILRNMHYLEESITDGQKEEISRLLWRIQHRLGEFLNGDGEEDDGAIAGEE
jgi:hypothetical protein